MKDFLFKNKVNLLNNNMNINYWIYNKPCFTFKNISFINCIVYENLMKLKNSI